MSDGTLWLSDQLVCSQRVRVQGTKQKGQVHHYKILVVCVHNRIGMFVGPD